MSAHGEPSNERNIVWVICLAAAFHVLVFATAFPVFNDLDESCHFDLVVRYSHDDLPRGLQPMSREASLYILTYNSPEFMNPPANYPGGHFLVPFWTEKVADAAARQVNAFAQAGTNWETIHQLPFWTNYEASQPPLYYAAGGLWWRMGQCLDVNGLSLVYWLRFLNAIFVATLVWVGYCGAKEIFPADRFFTLGVPALIAFAPMQVFYSIDNDVLSPICFGLAFLFLIRLWRAEVPNIFLGIALGLSLAATYLTKLSNVPLLAVSVFLIVLKMFQLAQNEKLRSSLPAFLALFICAAVPVAAWLAWMKIAFGDFTGSSAKLQFITWTLKPFSEWWHHPLFTPAGLWAFTSQLVWTFWQGNLHWHGNFLAQPSIDTVYVMLSLALLLFAAINLIKRRPSKFQLSALGFCSACLLAGSLFLAWLSIIYDFGICRDPSREHPYLAEGRLLLGALVPCLLLFLFGLDYLVGEIKNRWARPAALGLIILFMLVSEILTDRTVFLSQYNWYHL